MAWPLAHSTQISSPSSITSSHVKTEKLEDTSEKIYIFENFGANQGIK